MQNVKEMKNVFSEVFSGDEVSRPIAEIQHPTELR